MSGVENIVVCKFLRGLGSFGRLVGNISAYPGTSPTSWCRVMTKHPGWIVISVHGLSEVGLLTLLVRLKDLALLDMNNGFNNAYTFNPRGGL